MRHRLFFILILLAGFCTKLPAAHLQNMPLSLNQPDGSKIECFASGDEYHNWLHDSKNYTIIRDPKTGYHCYAELSGDQVQASKLIVGQDLPVGLTPGVNISEAAYQEVRRSKFSLPETRNAPSTGTINNLVIFVRFAGEAEFNQNISLYDGWFNSNTSSQKNYFLEASYNQLTVDTHFYPTSAGSSVISWQDSHSRSYFQPYNAGSNPNGYNGDTERRNREFTLLQNACAAIQASIPNDLVIDSDGDGKVDNVVFIISGGPDGWNELLWPHRWAIYSQYVFIHGKRVYDFNFQLADFLSSQNVGVICHEFFHTLGAPDLYHYSSNNIEPVGKWDLMQSNTNPPQHMGAYMKYKYGGWISSIPTISADQVYSLNPLTMREGSAYRIDSSDPNQYFVLEYRRKTGTFESSLPNSGLLAYRIDTRYNGNASGPPDEVYLFRPGGTPTTNGSILNANFSLESGRTIFNSETSPYSFMQDGSLGSLSFCNVRSAAEATLTFTKGLLPVIEWDFKDAPYQESFESSFPPNGWANVAQSGNYAFEQLTTGTYPSCSPFDGSAMLRYTSYLASTGSSAMLVAPVVRAPDTEAWNYRVSFAMYRDSGYISRPDRVELYLNSSPNLSGSPILIATVNRNASLHPVAANTGWHQYSFELPLAANSTNYIVFKAISAYGNNIYLDDIGLSLDIRLPFSEAFDSVLSPYLPPAFSAIKSSSSSSATVRSYSSQSYSAPNCVQMSNGNDTAADLRLVATSIKGGLQLLRLRFQARASSANQALLIGTQATATSAFTPLHSLSLDTSYRQIDLCLTSYTGSDTFLAFKHGLGATNRNIYLDDIEILLLPAYDLEISKFSAPSYAMASQNVRFDIEVRNSSQNAMHSYTLKLLDLQSSSLLTQSVVYSTLSAGSSRIHTLFYDFPASGSYRLIAQVQHQDDGEASNDNSAVQGIQVLAAAAEIHPIGQDGASFTTNIMPFNFYWKNNISESIYTARELFFPDGQISGLIYHYNFVQDISDKPLKVWVKNTTASDLSASWLNGADYTLVFDSTVNFESGSGSLYLHFIQPFQYNGANLAIRTNRPMDSSYYNSANHFRQYNSTLEPYRSRYFHSDGTISDPLTPPGNGTLISSLPQISLVFEALSLDSVVPQLSFDSSGSHLSWDAMQGARSYQIWHSEDLLTWTLLSWQETCSFEPTVADKAFFRIVASSARTPPESWSGLQAP